MLTFVPYSIDKLTAWHLWLSFCIRSSLLYHMSCKILHCSFSTIASGSCLYHFSFLTTSYLLNTYFPFFFFLYPIIPSFIFFLSQLTTFTDGMFHSLISFSTQPVLAIFLSLTHIYFNCICSFCLVLWSTYRTLSSPFQTSWF